LYKHSQEDGTQHVLAVYSSNRQTCTDRRVILRLHDQANIEQSSIKYPANAFKIHVHDVYSNCSMFARRLFDVCFM